MSDALLNPLASATSPLRAQRWQHADNWSAQAGQTLGALWWGASSEGQPGGSAPVIGVDAALLWPAQPCVDAWLGRAPVRVGHSGAVRWREDGQWLFGWVDLPAAELDLTEAAYRGYHEVFQALADAGGPRRLLRLWNYLPRINDDGGGLERYRQFNIGRQQAFIEAGLDAFEGAPAACALGKRGGALGIRFLAGRVAPLPVENPRQVPAYRYSAEFGPRSPTFSRAAVADVGGGQVGLFISGTASIVGEQSMHPGDVRAQTRETLANLRAVSQAAQARCTARFDLADLECVVYVRHAADLATIRAELAAAVGLEAPMARTAVYVEADVCRSELLVEIEAQALAPGVLVR